MEGRSIFREFKKYFFDYFSTYLRPSGLSQSIEQDRKDIAVLITKTFGEHILYSVEEEKAKEMVDVVMALVFCHKFNDQKYV